jgi:hypothetical protein
MNRILLLINIIFILLCKVDVSFAENKPTGKNDNSINKESIGQSLLSMEYFSNHLNEINMDKPFNPVLDPKDKIRESTSRKSPWLAFGLSYLFPGLGQLYNGDYLKAALFPTACLAGLALVFISYPGADFSATKEQETVGIIGICIAFGSYIWNLIDAPVSANRINKENNLSSSKIISIEDEKYVEKINPELKTNQVLFKLSLSF